MMRGANAPQNVSDCLMRLSTEEAASAEVDVTEGDRKLRNGGAQLKGDRVAKSADSDAAKRIAADPARLGW